MNEHLATGERQPLGTVRLRPNAWTPKDVTPFPTSAKVPDGNYELETVEVSQGPNKEGTGTNVIYVDKIVGPAYEGALIVTQNPLPIGPEDSESFLHGQSFMLQRLRAVYAHKGKDFNTVHQLEEADLPGEKTFKGSRFFATLRVGRGDYSNKSEIRFYLTDRKQYEAAPGPTDRTATGGQSTANSPLEGSGKKSSTKKVDVMAEVTGGQTANGATKVASIDLGA